MSLIIAEKNIKKINTNVIGITVSAGSWKPNKFITGLKFSWSYTMLGSESTVRNGITAPKLAISRKDAKTINKT